MKSRLKWLLFRMWKKRKYKKFLKEDNWDFDFSSILYFLELKLTIMGTYFAKYGICVDKKKQAHECWEARREIKRYFNAFDITYEQCQKEFIAKYGCKYEFTMYSEPIEGSPLHSLEFRVISPVEDKEEAEKFWHSLKQHEREYEMQQKAKNKAFELIAKNIEGWWD